MNDPILTCMDIFGTDDPWLDPTVTGPKGTQPLGAEYYAKPQTAAIVASIIGGVVTTDDPFADVAGDPFRASNPMEFVQLSSGPMLNAGLIAGFFTHGYHQSQLEGMIESEVYNSQMAAGLPNVQVIPVSLSRFVPAPPPPPPAQKIGSFAQPISGANPLAYNMFTNNDPSALAFNGKTNLELGITSPDGAVYIAWVWSNGLFQSVTGRFTRIG